MEYVLNCLCSLLCVVCGAWAAKGMPVPRRKKPAEPESECGEDALSRDIAAMLAYTIPGKEKPNDEE